MSKTLKEILNCADDEIREWLRTASLEDVEGFIAGSSPVHSIHRHAINERDRRYALRAREPHWTVTPGLIIGFLAMVFAAIAAWPVVREWLLQRTPAAHINPAVPSPTLAQQLQAREPNVSPTPTPTKQP